MGRSTAALISDFCGLLSLVIAVATAAAAADLEVEMQCPREQLAQYRVVFKTFWSEKEFPKHYPQWRPHAQWTKLLGLTHSGQHQVFREGEVATPQLKEFAETGRSDSLDAVTYESQGSKVLDAFYAPAIREGVGETQAKFFADGNHSMVSMVAKIVPSPDWFVGVDSLQLCVAGHWLNATSLELSPMDAGTDQGLAFTSPSWQLTPADVIKRITNTSPSHPASSFAYPEKTSLPTMASVSIVKIREYRLVKPTVSTTPLRIAETTTPRTTEPTTTTTSTTVRPAQLHEIDHNYIIPSLHAGSSIRPLPQKQRQISSPTSSRRQKSVDGGTVGAEVRNIVHSISNSGETLPEITTNISHAIRSQEVPSRDPPYIISNSYARQASDSTSARNEIHVPADDTKSSREESTVANENQSTASQNQHLSDDSNLISNDVAVLTNSVNEDENREANVHPGRQVSPSAVLPRDQYDRLLQEKHRLAIERHERDQQQLQEKRRKLKEKRRKHRERKLAATRTDRRELTGEPEEPGLNRHRLLKQSSSLHIIPRGDAMSVIDNIVETYQRDQRRKRRLQRRMERRRRRKLNRLNGIAPRRSKQAVDCKVGDWSAWSSCSKTCGIGEQMRTREILQHPRRGGNRCPTVTETTWCGSARDCHRDYFKW